MGSLIFELKNVYFSYLGKFPALQDINISINRGEKISIVGANGSGKSTFLQLLDGLIFADRGSVKFLSRELNEKSLSDNLFSNEFRSKVGFVFQNADAQLFCPSVKDDLVFGPLQLGHKKSAVEERLGRLAYELDIADLLTRSPHQLSIGEKRKVAIASTLIIEPDVLILDEPTAGLDPQTTRRIIDILLEANERGKTIITATHDLHIVEEISDTVYVFGREKKIVKSGGPEFILSDTRLLKENNLMHVHSHRHKDKIHTHEHLHLDHHAGEH